MPIATDPKFKVQTRFHSINGVSRDDVVNDMFVWFDNGGAEPGAGDFANVAEALSTFWCIAPLGTPPAVGSLLSRVIDRGPEPSLSFYRLPPTPGPLGAPVARQTLHLALPAPTVDAADLPEQVAVVMSYRGDYGTDTEFGPGTVEPTDARARHEGAPATFTGTITRPRNSDRGRIYIGPLVGTAFLVDTTTGRVGVASNVASNIGQAARSMALTLAGSTPAWHWIQWSHKRWSGKPVVEASVDDRPDTQRRRLTRPSVRIRVAISS